MKILALLRPEPTRSAETANVSIAIVEQRRLWKLYRHGQVLELYLDPESMVVTLLLDVADIASAHALLDGLPLLSGAGHARTLVRLGPWLPFALLFESGAGARPRRQAVSRRRTAPRERLA